MTLHLDGTRVPPSSSLESPPPEGGSRWRADGRGWQHARRPLAHEVSLAGPMSADEAGSIAARLDEAREVAGECLRRREAAELPASFTRSRIDVLARHSFREDELSLVSIVSEDPVHIASTCLGLLEQMLVWKHYFEQDRDAVCRVVDAFEEPARRSRDESSFRARTTWELVPVLAFEDPPPIAVARLARRILDEVADLDPSRAMHTYEIWAWPRERRAFRIPRTHLVGRGSGRRCRSCESPYVLKIVRGMPTREAEAAAARGEFALGGCLVGESDPTWTCRACGHAW